MCGFAGVITWSNSHRTGREALVRMSDRLAHRGPDGEGIYLSHEDEVTIARPQAALVHRRLSILDPDPRSNQPFHIVSPDGAIWLSLVFNGEIYNYRELKKELTECRPEYGWRTSGDTEVLLLAYDTWGRDCLVKLNGMFAFAVWDERKRELFLARDRMGQKPLYVAYLDETGSFAATLNQGVALQSPQTIAFASELSALRLLDWPDWQTDVAALGNYLSYGYVPACQTIYRGVRQLRPGECLFASGAAAEVGTYRSCDTHSPLSDEKAVQWTGERVREAVRRQLVSDVPLGCFLSGGIDSSIIATAMKATVPRDQPVLTFSMGFDDRRYDERQYAEAVARHLGTTHHSAVVHPHAAEDLPKLAAVFGEPFGDSSALPTHYLAREARQFVKVALSGDGGDELFGGYDRYRAMRFDSWLNHIPASLRALLAGTVARNLPGTHPKSRIARLKRFLKSINLSPAERYASYMTLFSNKQIDDLLIPSLRAELVSNNDMAALMNAMLAHMDPVRSALAVDRATYLPGDLLTKVDRASMLHNLEVRSPFMDPDVVNLAASLTTPQLLAGGPKRMLREAFAADLPAWVFKRRKMGFAVPIGQWLRTDLRDMLNDLFFSTDSFAMEHFQKPALERLVADHASGRVDHSQRLYALLMLELWWRG